MGYTHYWTIKRDFSARTWGKIASDTRQLFANSPVALVGQEDDQTSKPIIEPDQIRFNGAGDDEYETFLLDRTRDSAFCKTARNPYDLIVCAVLIVANHHAPKGSFEVRSDGGMGSFVADYAGPHDSEWDDALAFVRKVLGPQYALPRLITHRRSDKSA